MTTTSIEKLYRETAEKIIKDEMFTHTCFADLDSKCQERMKSLESIIHDTMRPLVEENARLREAGQEALVALAVFKISDTDMPYPAIGKDLRRQILASHDMLLKALNQTETKP